MQEGAIQMSKVNHQISSCSAYGSGSKQGLNSRNFLSSEILSPPKSDNINESKLNSYSKVDD